MRFELQLPFYRCLITRFFEKVENAEKACGNDGYVTLDALSTELTTDAWNGLSAPDSMLAKFLTSSVFNKGSPDKINSEYLRIFGILHCAGSKSERAVRFFNILQEGGLEVHEHITAGDKDTAPVFEKMCGLATWEIFAFTAQNDFAKEYYNDGVHEQLKDQVETLREDHFIEDVYGIQSKLKSEEWLEAMEDKCAWVLNPIELRKRLLALAEV